MKTTKPRNNRTNRLAKFLSLPLILVAGVARLPPLFIEQILPVVLGYLVRLRTLSILPRKLTDWSSEQLTRQRRPTAAVKPPELHGV